MTTVKASHGFHTTEEGNATQFIYDMERYTLRDILPTLFGSMFLAIFPVILLQPTTPKQGIIEWVISVILITTLIKFLVNLNRKQRQFKMTNDSFEVDGKSYLRKDVTGLYFQEGKTEPVPLPYSNSTTVIVSGSIRQSIMASSVANLGNATGKALEIHGAKFKNNLARKNCKVLIRYGKKNITLAKGLTIDTAELIFNKIAEKMNSSKTQ